VGVITESPRHKKLSKLIPNTGMYSFSDLFKLTPIEKS